MALSPASFAVNSSPASTYCRCAARRPGSRRPENYRSNARRYVRAARRENPHRGGEREERLREAIGLAQLHGMLRVDVQATGTSNHRSVARQHRRDVREMLQRRGVLREGFRRPCAECVDDHIESGEICSVRSNRSLMMACWATVLFSPHYSGHVSPRSTASRQ